MNRKVDLREEKAEIGAPCIFICRDAETGRFAPAYPQVDCEHRCRRCGWNPAVRARRLKRRFG